jgi:hypothetical protein
VNKMVSEIFMSKCLNCSNLAGAKVCCSPGPADSRNIKHLKIGCILRKLDLFKASIWMIATAFKPIMASSGSF